MWWWTLIACAPKAAEPPSSPAPATPHAQAEPEAPEPEAAPPPPLELPASVDLDTAPQWSPAPARPTTRHGEWATHYNDAVAHFNASEFAGCNAVLARYLDLADDQARQLVRGLDWECAMYAGRFATAGARLGASIQDGTHPSLAAIQHAAILTQAGRPDEALAWLDLFALPDEARWQRTRLRALAVDGQWVELGAYASDPALPPHLRAAAGITLAGAGENELARRVLEEACPLLEEAAQPQCRQILARVSP